MGCPRPAALTHACCPRCRPAAAGLTCTTCLGNPISWPRAVGMRGEREQAVKTGMHGENSGMHYPLAA